MAQTQANYVISVNSDSGFNPANYMVFTDEGTGLYQMSTTNAHEYSGIPSFQFHLSHRYHYNGLITVGSEVIHCIIDVNDFYTALGFTDEIRASGLCFDDFLWNEYRKEDSIQSGVQLQAKLIEYLVKYSSTFMKKYSDQYRDWLDQCNELAEDYDDYTVCKWLPNQRAFNCILPSPSASYTSNMI